MFKILLQTLGGIYFFLVDFIFWSGFRVTAKLRGMYRNFPYTSCPHTCLLHYQQGYVFEYSVSWCWCARRMLAAWFPNRYCFTPYHSRHLLSTCRCWCSLRQVSHPLDFRFFHAHQKHIQQGLPTSIYNVFQNVHTNVRGVKFKNRFVLFKERILFSGR